jgi:DNA-directed RNA polymerase subunit K/omega
MTNIIPGDYMKKREYYIPVEDIWKVCDNKYKAIVITAKAARTFFEEDSDTEEKPTIRAIKKFVNEELKYEENNSGHSR